MGKSTNTEVGVSRKYFKLQPTKEWFIFEHPLINGEQNPFNRTSGVRSFGPTRINEIVQVCKVMTAWNGMDGASRITKTQMYTRNQPALRCGKSLTRYRNQQTCSCGYIYSNTIAELWYEYSSRGSTNSSTYANRVSLFSCGFIAEKKSSWFDLSELSRSLASSQ